MTRDQVQLNYEEAIRQSERINSALDKLRQADNIHDSMNSISSDWRGDNANSFLKIFNELGLIFRKITDRLAGIETWIRDSAKRIYDAEMEAIRIAEERAYREEQARAAEAARRAEEARKAEEERRAQEQTVQAIRDFMNRLRH